MTREQKEICLQLKEHVDRVNRTGTLNIPLDYWAKVQEVHLQLKGHHIDSCRDCMITAIKTLYREANA
jgi:hypothetical protein